MQSKCNEKVNIPWKYQYTNDRLITVVMWNARAQSKLFFSTLVVCDNMASRSRLLWDQGRRGVGEENTAETRRASSGGRAGQWLNQRNGPWSRLTEWSHSQYKQQEQKMRLTIIWPKALAELHADMLIELAEAAENQGATKSYFYSLPSFPRKTTSLFSVGFGFK